MKRPVKCLGPSQERVPFGKIVNFVSASSLRSQVELNGGERMRESTPREEDNVARHSAKIKTIFHPGVCDPIGYRSSGSYSEQSHLVINGVEMTDQLDG